LPTRYFLTFAAGLSRGPAGGACIALPRFKGPIHVGQGRNWEQEERGVIKRERERGTGREERGKEGGEGKGSERKVR